MGKDLQQSLSNFSDKISDAVKSKKSILVTTHIDCDGIISGSIISKALMREDANYTVRTTNEFSQNLIQDLKKENKGLHIITDLGGGFGNDLDHLNSILFHILDQISIHQMFGIAYSLLFTSKKCDMHLIPSVTNLFVVFVFVSIPIGMLCLLATNSI